ncbi:DUF6332 family protein [Streptomyces sp. NBC_01352]|uniref:DUF6332 family protein n=1 Tax=Streptomyces sp. NBC_01352 TaxID=2903834 RepID=UPI003FCCCE3D
MLAPPGTRPRDFRDGDLRGTAVLFPARVVSALLRFRPGRPQPSQPGRTNPDS